METEKLKEKVLKKIKEKYRIDSYKKVVETIIDITIQEVQNGN